MWKSFLEDHPAASVALGAAHDGNAGATDRPVGSDTEVARRRPVHRTINADLELQARRVSEAGTSLRDLLHRHVFLE